MELDASLIMGMASSQISDGFFRKTKYLGQSQLMFRSSSFHTNKLWYGMRYCLWFRQNFSLSFKALLTCFTCFYQDLYDPGHNILALFNNLAYVWITTNKAILDI